MSPDLAWGVLSTVPPREFLQYHIVFLITILHNRFYYLIGKPSSFTLSFKIVLVITVPLYFPINFIDSPGGSDG